MVKLQLVGRGDSTKSQKVLEVTSLEVIEMLENLLVLARNGEISGIAGIYQHTNNQFGYQMTGSFCDNPLLAVTQLSELQKKILGNS